MICMPLQTTPAVRIYLLVFFFFFPLFHHDSWATSSGNGPHLNFLHKKPILFLSKICLVGQQCWSWITVLSPKLPCPHTHIVRIVNVHACMHMHTHTHTHTKSFRQQQQAQFSASHWVWMVSHIPPAHGAHDLELQTLKFPQNRDLVFDLVWLSRDSV